jgi:outer membrane lipoprotein-sorting protein
MNYYFKLIFRLRNKSCLLFILSGFYMGPIWSQKKIEDPKAKLILSQTSQKYRSINTLMANFIFTLFSPQDKVNQSQSGSLWVRPGTNQYRIEFKDQILICDGTNSYTVLKKQNEVQINKVDTSSQNINPAKIFTLYEKGFSYLFGEELIENKQKLDRIDLIPNQSKKIFKAQIYINRISKMVYRIKTFDKNGDQLIYTISSYNLKPSVGDSFFLFNKKDYPGIEIIDLR